MQEARGAAVMTISWGFDGSAIRPEITVARS